MAGSQQKTPAMRLATSQLLYPELLSNDDLKAVLKDRCVALKKVDAMTREELLAVVHRVAVPLPQRSLETPEVAHLQCALQGASMSSTPKPPKKLDNCINYQHRVIKLNRSGSSSSSESTNGHGSKRARISLKRTEPSTEQQSPNELGSNPAKKSRAKITWP